MIALASSLTNVFSQTGLMACGISSKLKVELEPVYIASALLAMAQLGWLGANAMRGGECFGVGLRKAHGAFI